MDESRLFELDRQTFLIVPTAGLATHLNSIYAGQKMQQGNEVWEAPNIISWSECVNHLWRLNQQGITTRALLSSQQAKLLWSQAIEQSRYQNIELTLLNVPQTVTACMRSDRLLHDWCVERGRLEDIHISDVSQFLEWQQAYERLLHKANATDFVRLQQSIIEMAQAGELRLGIKKIIWYGYDLLTDAQRCLSDLLADFGVAVSHAAPALKGSQRFEVYPDIDTELRQVLEQAKQALEDNVEQSVQIIVPDLQHRYAQVQELARQVFYPRLSPLDTQRNNLVYRFSLGKNLHQWPAIESALTLLQALNGRLSLADVSFILRSRFLHATTCEAKVQLDLIAWMKKRRFRQLSVERLPEIVAEYCEQNNTEPDTIQPLIELLTKTNELLVQQSPIKRSEEGSDGDEKRTQRQPYSHWVGVFNELLELWGWQTYPTGGDFNTVEHQLRQRWDSLIEEYAKFSLVQRTVGLHKAISRLQQFVKESIFLPKSAHSPLVISGVLEALGKTADLCFLTGMTQSYPAAAKGDPFIPNSVLNNTGYPDASAQTSIKQAQKVIRSLFDSSRLTHVSYALKSDTRQDTENQASPLFAQQFQAAELFESSAGGDLNENPTLFETYTDTQGAPWDKSDRAKGGAGVFRDQSQCPFKAYATHRLGFEREEEAEFGLDHLDRGVLIHKMLELVWRAIPDQSSLLKLSEIEQSQLLKRCFEELMAFCANEMSDDKLTLFALEEKRVAELTAEWLELERKRPEHFSVVEREEAYRGEWGGIEFKFTLDRVDVLDDGTSLIIDYKTGNVDRNNLKGGRLREPQLPLYMLTRNAQKASQAAGIAFAELKRGSLKFVELAEQGIFRKPSRFTENYQADWQEGRERWPELFSRLASDYLAGEASVDPIDKKVCERCDLASMCRVQELREHSSVLNMAEAE